MRRAGLIPDYARALRYPEPRVGAALVGALVLASASLLPRLAAAQGADDPCAKLEQAHKDKPSSGTLLELADCHEQNGKPAKAMAEFGEAAELAHKERRWDREKTATQKKKAVEPKLPKVTLSVAADAMAVEGLVITLDGKPVDKSVWGTGIPVEAGEHSVAALAPGRSGWDTKVSVAVGERKTVAVPAPGGAGAAAAPKPAAPAAAAAAGEPPPAAAPAEPEKPARVAGQHDASRLVVELDGAAAFLYGGVAATSVDGIQNLTYHFQAKDAVYDQTCGAENCEAEFSPDPGLGAGGSLFVGWALSETFHLGGRALGGARLPSGFFLAGGPAFSMKLTGPVWIGLAGLVGAMEQTADLKDVRGRGPGGVVAIDGSETVEVPTQEETPVDSPVTSSIAFGGSIELCYVLTEFAPLGGGSVRLSTWPTFMQGLKGFVIAVPVGIGVRFH